MTKQEHISAVRRAAAMARRTHGGGRPQTRETGLVRVYVTAEARRTLKARAEATKTSIPAVVDTLLESGD